MVVRLKEVAERAGVSMKTASNVINHHPHVRPVTRAKVQAAIDELGYRPNLAARQLKHGRGGFLALAVPQLDSPYFAELAERLSAEANRRGYLLLLDMTHADHDGERLVLAGMQAHMIDGVIFSPLAVTAEEVAARTDTRPLVLLGERGIPADHDYVAVDSYGASRGVAEHLIQIGRRRLAAVGREALEGTASARLGGFTAAIDEAGIELLPEHVIDVTGYTREDGAAAMRTLLAGPTRPDAVFCFNDLMAIGAIRACHQAGVRVPEDVAIVGFDDIPEGRFHTPSLTTVAPDLDALVDQVLTLLLARIADRQREAEQVKVSWQLQVRESTVGNG
ncbi:LacI family DNA-binding transcriptional regulator [Ruania halotolerans]|uniref:LacI family DNA-binding transcriptional regulator n=1 Tax=Ruania halotolerans TaxID=2897773 RepID=UPI001E64178B|nr:LacI family DNA-binding transcriptional regulator [Ruania halotolerans]UFU07990.1 LacI family transcriptional regulator [Ruania halotolerans]